MCPLQEEGKGKRRGVGKGKGSGEGEGRGSKEGSEICALFSSTLTSRPSQTFELISTGEKHYKKVMLLEGYIYIIYMYVCMKIFTHYIFLLF